MNTDTIKTLEILKELIEYKSVNPSGNEKGIALHIEKTLKSLGLKTEIQDLGNNRANIIARIGDPSKGPTIAFNGHLDVVPAGEGWISNPFKAEIREDKVYGRGTADMKGGIATIMSVVQKLLEENYQFSGELILIFVADEESTNLGTLEYLKTSEKPDLLIIMEPTNLEVNTAHKGTARFTLKVHGTSCHSSNPSNGVNAILNMAKVILALEEFNKKILTERTHSLLSNPTLASCVIKGGTKSNIIPDCCELQIDRRLIPGETKETAEKELVDLLNNLSEKEKELKYSLEEILSLNPGEVNENFNFLDKLKKVYSKTLKKDLEFKPFNATCEQTLFVDKGIDTIILGPGNLKEAHIIDEYIEVKQLEEAFNLYLDLIKEII